MKNDQQWGNVVIIVCGVFLKADRIETHPLHSMSHLIGGLEDGAHLYALKDMSDENN